MALENLELKLRRSLTMNLHDRYNLRESDFIRYRQSPGLHKEFLNLKRKVEDYIKSIDFPQGQIDFLKSFINLRDVDHNIKGIELDIQDKWYLDYFEHLDKGYRLPKPIRQFVNKNKQRVLLTFWLYKQFCDLNDFKNYITNHKLPAKNIQQNKDFNTLGFNFYHEGNTCVFRDSRLLALLPKKEPVEKVLVYCDSGRVVLD